MAHLTLQFLGGAGTVTGSKTLLSRGADKVLIDCGLFQGLKNLRLKNWDSFPVPPSSLGAVVLTHAHLDHSGYLPKLVREGFRGPIYATPATIELCRILLMDSAFLMEEDASYSNRKGISRHRPALPLYTMDDAQQAMGQFVPVEFDQPQTLFEGTEFRFLYAGHIPGAAMIHLRGGGRTILFSGDLGRPRDPILFPPVKAPAADVLVLESTYGNKTHPVTDPLADLESVIRRTVDRGGVVLIPAFAVGRAQEIAGALAELRRQGRLPHVPVFLNSPMATRAAEILQRFRHLQRLPDEALADLARIAKPVTTAEESKELNERQGPMIIISASGMLTGGRVVHHLKAFAPDPKNTIILAGFQAAGTRGQALRDGAREVKIHGQYVPVRAEIVGLDTYSAHADAPETLQWLEQSTDLRPQRVFLNHGEPAAADELRRRITERFGWTCSVPEAMERVEL